MNEIAVVLPAYNEENDIDELITKWESYKEILNSDYHLFLKIVVVDDGSSDSTKSICEKLEKEYYNFQFVSHEKNKGLGMAVKTGIEYVLKNYPDSLYMCIMDCDNTHNPKYIINMLNKEKETNADVIIASRYENGAKVLGVPGVRIFTSYMAKYVYSLILNVKNVQDYTCGYRLYKRSILEKFYKNFGQKMVEENGFTCMAEILYKLYMCGAVFAEVPFELRYDLKNGSSKMRVIKTSINSFKLAVRLTRLKKIEM